MNTATDAMEMRDAFVETATRLAVRDIAPRAESLDIVAPDPSKSADVCTLLRDAGLIDMAAPESAGGLSLDAAAVGAVLARLAESCAGTALLAWAHESAHLQLAAAGIEPCVPEGGEALDRLVANGTVSTHALTATRDGDGWVIDGSVSFAWGHGVAGNLLIAAAIDDEPAGGGLFAVLPAQADGIVVRERHDRIGARACPSATLDFRRVRIAGDDAQVLPGIEFRARLEYGRAIALALVGAIAAGNARGALRRAVRYARERYQGGDVIIAHALVRNMLGKSLADLRAAEALVDTALAQAGDPASRAPDDAVLAKVVATRNAEQVCLDAMQVFGGYGYMRDYGVEKHLRDAKMLCLVGGNNDRLLQALVDTHRSEEDWP